MPFRVGLSVDTKQASIAGAVALGAESLEIFVPPDLKWETDPEALKEALAEAGLPYTVHTFLTAMLAHEDPGIRSRHTDADCYHDIDQSAPQQDAEN